MHMEFKKLPGECRSGYEFPDDFSVWHFSELKDCRCLSHCHAHLQTIISASFSSFHGMFSIWEAAHTLM